MLEKCNKAISEAISVLTGSIEVNNKEEPKEEERESKRQKTDKI